MSLIAFDDVESKKYLMVGDDWRTKVFFQRSEGDMNVAPKATLWNT